MVCSRNGVSIIFIFTTPCHPCQARQLQLWFLPLGQGLGVRQKNPQKIHTKKHVAGPNLRCRVRPRVLFDLEVQPCNVFLLNRWIGSGAIPVKKPFTNGSTLTFAFVSHFAATNLCWVFQSIQKVKDDGQRTPYRRQAHTHISVETFETICHFFNNITLSCLQNARVDWSDWSPVSSSQHLWFSFAERWIDR